MIESVPPEGGIAAAKAKEGRNANMATSQLELARRLKAARENCGLTQAQVADALGVARTAVVQIEAGRRAVTSLELDVMARAFGRGLTEFVSDEAFEDDPVLALFRSAQGVVEDSRLGRELRRCAGLCREATSLEQILGQPGGGSAMEISYTHRPPTSKWDAICQGRSMAEQERSRLGLGHAPVWEIAAMIRSQGVRVAEYPMPDDISGIFLHHRALGLVVIVNREHPRNRRLFSYGHEYCHVLADRRRSATVSRDANREELVEIRANAFAAHFLMPEAGVRAFMQALGKGEATRQIQEVFDDPAVSGRAQLIQVQKRMPPGSQTVHIHDVVRVAHHFGVSHGAALYQLLNLRLVSKEQFDCLNGQRLAASRIAHALRIETWDENAHWSLAAQILTLGLEAYRRGAISRRKLIELAEQVDVTRDEIDAVLDARDDEAVDVIMPE